jgi:hypothetical protein
MANRERGELDFVIGGREFTLTPSFEAMAELEDRVDRGIFEIANRLRGKDVRAKLIVCSLWAGVKFSPQNDLTFQQFSDLCMKGGAVAISKCASPAIRFVHHMFMGKDEAEKKSLGEESSPPPQL